MKKLLTYCVILAVAISTTFAATTESITANNVITSFTGGVNGTLSMTGDDGIITYNTSTGNIAEYGDFSLSIDLTTNNSSGTTANGYFAANGTFSFKDSLGNDILSGTVDYLNLMEVYNGIGMIAGEGSFTVTGGTLFVLGSTGSIVDVTFSISPAASFDSFSSGFSGALSNITFTGVAVPEPATVALLTMGALTILRKKNKNK